MIHLRKARAKAVATPIRCRCQTQTNPRRPCLSAAIPGSSFCLRHKTCKGSPLSGDEPPYDPERYNLDPVIQATHNCWSYSMNVLDLAQRTQCDGRGPTCQLLYHQPGGIHGHADTLRKAEGRTCPIVERLMREDVPDLKPSTFDARCPVGTSKIAMVVHPGEDYHFYRQDADGWWSHKAGATKVTRLDADGQRIWNPATAKRDYRPRLPLNYVDFCGFYCAPRKVAIRLSRGGGRRKRKTRRAKVKAL